MARASMKYPFSRDEHAAMARYLIGVKKQLQDVSDLVSTRYGKESGIAEAAVKTLVSTTLLEHEFSRLEANGQSEIIQNQEVSRAAYAAAS